MGKGAAILALLIAIISIPLAIVFLPVIQGFTNSTNANLMASLNSSGMADTPFAPIMHLWPVWSILLIVVCIVIIFVAVSKAG